jgi:hypothetical protein
MTFRSGPGATRTRDLLLGPTRGQRRLAPVSVTRRENTVATPAGASQRRFVVTGNVTGVPTGGATALHDTFLLTLADRGTALYRRSAAPPWRRVG